MPGRFILTRQRSWSQQFVGPTDSRRIGSLKALARGSNHVGGYRSETTADQVQHRPNGAATHRGDRSARPTAAATALPAQSPGGECEVSGQVSRVPQLGHRRHRRHYAMDWSRASRGASAWLHRW